MSQRERSAGWVEITIVSAGNSASASSIAISGTHVAHAALRLKALRAQDRDRAIDALLRGRDRAVLVPGIQQAVMLRDCRRQHEEARRPAILDATDLGEQLVRTYGLVGHHQHSRHGVLRLE